MKKPVNYCIDIQKLCDIKGPLHAYFIDTHNIILACNKLKADFFYDLFDCKEVIGSKPADLLKDSNVISAAACYQENLDILKTGQPRQAYHSWTIRNLYSLDLLTFKMPTYDTNGKPLGLLVISHFMNKFSVEKAFNLGLTKRETECLFYLLEGHTAKEIAKTLKLSPRTVEGYVDNMKTKLDCPSTSELLLMALQNEVKTGYGGKSMLDSISPVSELIEGRSSYSCLPIDLT